MHRTFTKVIFEIKRNGPQSMYVSMCGEQKFLLLQAHFSIAK